MPSNMIHTHILVSDRRGFLVDALPIVRETATTYVSEKLTVNKTTLRPKRSAYQIPPNGSIQLAQDVATVEQRYEQNRQRYALEQGLGNIVRAGHVAMRIASRGQTSDEITKAVGLVSHWIQASGLLEL